VIGAKTKVLKEEDDETVVAADESGAAAAAAAYAARAANELSGAFSATLGSARVARVEREGRAVASTARL
jgi:hypothetical protein